MAKLHDTSIKKEKVILVGLIYGKQDEKVVQEYLDELEFLAETAGAEIYERFTQRLVNPHPATFVGSGKLQEILSTL